MLRTSRSLLLRTLLRNASLPDSLAGVVLMTALNAPGDLGAPAASGSTQHGDAADSGSSQGGVDGDRGRALRSSLATAALLPAVRMQAEVRLLKVLHSSASSGGAQPPASDQLACASQSPGAGRSPPRTRTPSSSSEAIAVAELIWEEAFTAGATPQRSTSGQLHTLLHPTSTGTLAIEVACHLLHRFTRGSRSLGVAVLANPPLSDALALLRRTASAPPCVGAAGGGPAKCCALWTMGAEVVSAVCLADVRASSLGVHQIGTAQAVSAPLLEGYAAHLDSLLAQVLERSSLAPSCLEPCEETVDDVQLAASPRRCTSPHDCGALTQVADQLHDWWMRWLELLTCPEPMRSLSTSALQSSLRRLTKGVAQGKAPTVPRLRYLAESMAMGFASPSSGQILPTEPHQIPLLLGMLDKI